MRIVVSMKSGQSIPIDVVRTATIAAVKAAGGLPVACRLMRDRIVLEDALTLADYEIQEGMILQERRPIHWFTGCKTFADRTPLHVAAMSGRRDAVERLCDANMQLARRKTMHGWTPLHTAITGGYLEVIEVLLLKCPDCVFDRTNDGRSTVALCLMTSYTNVLRLLLSKWPTGADQKNVDGLTPHEWAIKYNPKMAQVFGDFKAERRQSTGDQLQQ